MENGRERFCHQGISTLLPSTTWQVVCVVIDIIEEMKVLQPVVCYKKGFQFHRERFLPPRHLDTAAGAA